MGDSFSGESQGASAKATNPMLKRSRSVKSAFSEATHDTKPEGNHSSKSLVSAGGGGEKEFKWKTGVGNDFFTAGPPKEAVVFAGMLLKRGGESADAGFRFRWVRVTTRGIGYAATQGDNTIEDVGFGDVVGIILKKNLEADGVPEKWRNLVQKLQRSTFLAQHGDDLPKGLKSYSVDKANDQNQAFFREGTDFFWEKEHAATIVLSPFDFGVCTSKQGYHSGRVFVFRTENVHQQEKWAESILGAFRLSKIDATGSVTQFERVRRKVRWFYNGDLCQISVAVLIMGNFLVNIFEATFNAKGGDVDPATGEVSGDAELIALFALIDIIFTVIFSFELATNMFATLFWDFVLDAWNWFDAVVVVVSWCALVLDDVPGAEQLRLMRCFRVFRLFKRIPSLRQIIVALSASIPPMINAFALVCLVTAIYAIVCVSFFSGAGESGQELFGDFFSSMFTLFQIMTADNWSGITRELMAIQNSAVPALVMVSFQLIVGLVLLNVVIAVLLDEFSKAANKADEDIQSSTDSEDRCPFERISLELSSYRHRWDLNHRIDKLFDIVGQDVHSEAGWEKTRLSFAHFREGFKELNYQPAVLISQSAWDNYVVAERLIDENGKLSLAGFRRVLLSALARWQLRQLNRAAQDENGWGGEKILATLFGMKGLVYDPDALGPPGGFLPNSSDAASHSQIVQTLRGAVLRVEEMHARFDAVEGFYRATAPSTFSRTASGDKQRPLSSVGSVIRMNTIASAPASSLEAQRHQLECQLADLNTLMLAKGADKGPKRAGSAKVLKQESAAGSNDEGAKPGGALMEKQADKQRRMMGLESAGAAEGEAVEGEEAAVDFTPRTQAMNAVKGGAAALLSPLQGLENIGAGWQNPFQRTATEEDKAERVASATGGAVTTKAGATLGMDFLGSDPMGGVLGGLGQLGASFPFVGGGGEEKGKVGGAAETRP